MEKEFLNEIKAIFPKAEIKEKSGKIFLIDNQKQEMADFCEGLAKQRGKEIEIKHLPEIIITIESFGQISTGEMFKRAVDELKKDIELIEKQISKN